MRKENTKNYWQYSARINSFLVKSAKHSKTKVSDAVRDIGSTQLVQYVDLNYPQHLKLERKRPINAALKESGLKVNTISLRYNLSEFEKGALSHLNKAVRKKATDITLGAIDLAQEFNTNKITLWLSQEVCEESYPKNFKIKYHHLLTSLSNIIGKNPHIKFSIEYKMSQKRPYMLVNNVGTTLLLLENLKFINTGITIDFCHSIMAREDPAFSAESVFLHSHLYGVHLNDSAGHDDDGFTTATVHKTETKAFIMALIKNKYKEPIYFDTFPTDNPATELRENISRVENITKKTIASRSL